MAYKQTHKGPIDAVGDAASALVFALAMFASLSGGAAGTYKWVDEKGVVHYSDTLPPQYSNRANSQLNKRGITVKKTEAAQTGEQLKAAEAERERGAEEVRRNAEEGKRNQLLLDTYVNESEIDLARDRALEGPDGRIKLASDRMKIVTRKEEELQARLKANEERGAKPPSEAVLQNLETLKSERKRLENMIGQAEREKTEIAARFESDKLRFRDIKAGREVYKAAIPDKPTEAMVKNCFDLWLPTLAGGNFERAYLVGSEISRAREPVELFLDVRSRNRLGQFSSNRASCPLRSDGTVDAEGTSARTARFVSKQ